MRYLSGSTGILEAMNIDRMSTKKTMLPYSKYYGRAIVRKLTITYKCAYGLVRVRVGIVEKSYMYVHVVMYTTLLSHRWYKCTCMWPILVLDYFAIHVVLQPKPVKASSRHHREQWQCAAERHLDQTSQVKMISSGRTSIFTASLSNQRSCTYKPRDACVLLYLEYMYISA